MIDYDSTDYEKIIDIQHEIVDAIYANNATFIIIAKQLERIATALEKSCQT